MFENKVLVTAAESPQTLETECKCVIPTGYIHLHDMLVCAQRKSFSTWGILTFPALEN